MTINFVIYCNHARLKKTLCKNSAIRLQYETVEVTPRDYLRQVAEELESERSFVSTFLISIPSPNEAGAGRSIVHAATIPVRAGARACT